jgi:hypothetical protein
MSTTVPRAVGITRRGELIGINSIDAARGLVLKAILISSQHATWGRLHEEMLRMCFTFNGHGGVADENNDGEIIYLESDEEPQTENTRGNRGARWENRR